MPRRHGERAELQQHAFLTSPMDEDQCHLQSPASLLAEKEPTGTIRQGTVLVREEVWRKNMQTEPKGDQTHIKIL